MICACGDHAWRPITKGFVTLVSPEDAHQLQHRWYASVGSKGDVYAVRSIIRGSARPKLRLHNEIMGASGGRLVDHKNLDGLDNRRRNLRHATFAQNAVNRRVKAGKSIPFKGVQKHHAGGFYSHIQKDGQRFHLGVFGTAEEAHAAYVGASRVLFGEFARAA